MPDSTDPLAWVARAEEDYALARSALRRRVPLTYGATFHAQQCVEKYIKALLVARGQPFPRTHDVVALSELCHQNGIIISVDLASLERLAAMPYRYVIQVRTPVWQKHKRRCGLSGLCVDSPEGCWSRADANRWALSELRVMLGRSGEGPGGATHAGAPAACGIIERARGEMEGSLSMTHVKVVIEKHPDGYIAYPLGLKGVIVSQGETYDEVLRDVKSAIRFHIETFGPEVFEDAEPILEAFIAETEVPGR
jgi:HEPN domain-containing protein/predicted RNase H-like HicB family nuclease